MVSLQGALWLLFFPLVFLYYAIFLGFLGYSFISSLTMKSLSHTIVALSGIVFICTSVYLNVFKSTLFGSWSLAQMAEFYIIGAIWCIYFLLSLALYFKPTMVTKLYTVPVITIFSTITFYAISPITKQDIEQTINPPIYAKPLISKSLKNDCRDISYATYSKEFAEEAMLPKQHQTSLGEGLHYIEIQVTNCIPRKPYTSKNGKKRYLNPENQCFINALVSPSHSPYLAYSAPHSNYKKNKKEEAISIKKSFAGYDKKRFLGSLKHRPDALETLQKAMYNHNIAKSTSTKEGFNNRVKSFRSDGVAGVRTIPNMLNNYTYLTTRLVLCPFVRELIPTDTLAFKYPLKSDNSEHMIVIPRNLVEYHRNWFIKND